MYKFIKVTAFVFLAIISLMILAISFYSMTAEKWDLKLTNTTNHDVTFITNYCTSASSELTVSKQSTESFSCYSAMDYARRICVDDMGCSYLQHEVGGGFMSGTEVQDVEISTDALDFDTSDQWKAKLGSDSKESVLSVIRENKRNSNSRAYGYLKNVSDHLSKDEDIIIAVIKHLPREVDYVDQGIKNKSDFLLKAVKANPSVASYVKIDSKEIIQAAVKINPQVLAKVSELLRDDNDVVLAAVAKDGDALEFASSRLKGNKSVVLVAVKQSGDALRYAGGKLKEDKDVVLVAVSQTGQALFYAEARMKSDKDIALAAVRENVNAVKFVSVRLQNDEDVLKVVLDKIKNYSGYLSCIYDTSIHKNKKFMLAAIKQKPSIFSSMGGPLRKDEDIALAAVTQDGRLLGWADASLRKNKEIVLAAVANDGNAIWDADKTLQIDHDVLLLSVQNNSSFFDKKNLKSIDNKQLTMALINRDADLIHYMNDKFKGEKDVMLLAIKKSHESLLYTAPALRNSRQFSLEAAKLNGMAIEFIGTDYAPGRSIVYDLGRADNPMKNDLEIVLAAVKQNGLALQHVPISLRRNKIVVYEAVKQNKEAHEFAVGTDVVNEVYAMQKAAKLKLH